MPRPAVSYARARRTQVAEQADEVWLCQCGHVLDKHRQSKWLACEECECTSFARQHIDGSS